MRIQEELAEVEVLLLRRPNGHAIVVATDSDDLANEIVLPMSAITVKDTGRKEAGYSILQIAMGQSLAESKGLC